MRWIQEKRLELQKIIDTINGCGTTNNQTGFTLKSKNGVVWAKSKTGKKWGQAFEEDSRFYCVIDFPVDSYELKELVERIGLNKRKKDEQVSGLCLRRDTPFDSVQIAIYEEEATTYSFNNDAFIDFVNEVALKVRA